jgi:Na+/phosphate symporter
MMSDKNYDPESDTTPLKEKSESDTSSDPKVVNSEEPELTEEEKKQFIDKKKKQIKNYLIKTMEKNIRTKDRRDKKKMANKSRKKNRKKK